MIGGGGAGYSRAEWAIGGVVVFGWVCRDGGPMAGVDVCMRDGLLAWERFAVGGSGVAMGRGR